MGTFYVKGSIEHMVRREKSVDVPQMLVDTGSEHTWVPANLLEKIGVKREKKDVTFEMPTVSISRETSASRSCAGTSTSRSTKWFSPKMTTCRCLALGHWRV